MPLLCVNIDHTATVRQARYRDVMSRGGTEANMAEPDPVLAAHEAELGGADGITVHLREDRRHIVDRDVDLLRRSVRVKFNLEMGATDEMVTIACRVKPHTAMLVPEGRQEVTTEGGLDLVGNAPRLKEVVKKLHGAGIIVSAFIDADARQIDCAASLAVDVCEIHTGPYAHAFALAGGDFQRRELLEQFRAVRDAAERIVAGGMRCNAGHALNYANVGPVAQAVHAANATRSGAERGELHIGHAIVSRAIFTGLRTAVAEMKQAITQSLAIHAADHTSPSPGASDLGAPQPFNPPPGSPMFNQSNKTRLA